MKITKPNRHIWGGAIGGFLYSETNTNMSPIILTIKDCKIIGNKARLGGAIYDYNVGNTTITNCEFSENKATENGGAIYKYDDDGTMNLNFNRIVSNTADVGYNIYNERNNNFNAKNNWWGSNSGFTGIVEGTQFVHTPVDADPWLIMELTTNPITITLGQTSSIVANFNHNNDGIMVGDTTNHIPDGTIVTFTTDLGSIGSKTIQKQTVNGIATATLNADETTGKAHVTGLTDDQILTKDVTINSVIRPVVTSVDPVKNAGNVVLNKVVKITFNKNIKLGTNPWIEFKTAAGTAITFTTSIFNNVLSLTPTSLLKSGTTYNVVLHSNSVTDLSGLGLAAPYITVFTTTIPPVVTSTDPVNNTFKVATNKIVKFNFNKSIKLGTNPWIEFKDSSGTAKPFKLSVSGSTLSIKPTSALSKSTSYWVIVHSNAVTDLNGTGLAAPYTIKFKTRA